MEDNHSGDDYVNDEYPETYFGVYGTYLERLDSEKVLSVDVEWTSMDFEYAASQQGTWNPKTHTYDDGTDKGEWLTDNATITLRNHSNMDVKARMKFEPTGEEEAVNEENAEENNDNSIKGTFTRAELTLLTAENTTKDNPPSEETKFTISGDLTKTEDLGTITVKVSSAETKPLDISALDDTAITAAVTAWLNENGGPTLRLKMSGQLSKTTVQAINAGIATSDVDSVGLELIGATSIDSHGFSYAKASNITSVYAPDVYSIYDNAFYGNSSITSFTFPNVTSIGTAAFSYCYKMTELTFGKMITSPGSQTFSGTTTGDVTLTLSSEQKSGTFGNGYPATFGENGIWLDLTWKNIQEYQG